MKFRVTMKDPDTLNDAAMEALSENVANIDDISTEEQESLIDERVQDIMGIAEKWFEYGEYLTVEIDTEAKTCTVVPVDGVF